MSGTQCFQDLPEPFFSQALSHLRDIQNARTRHRLFEALDIGLNFLRELSARQVISPEQTADLGRLWGDEAEKRLHALPEPGAPAPTQSFAKNTSAEQVINSSIQTALEQLLALAERDTVQSRKVANFLLAWWNASENGGFDLADLYGLNGQSASACAAVFTWVAQCGATPESLGYNARFKALALKWRPHGDK